MISFEEFLKLVTDDKVSEIKRFEKSFYVMQKPGKFPMHTVGFLVKFDDKGWEDISELVTFFKPQYAWIGTKNHRTEFEERYPKVLVEPYSFFADGGFIPVSFIPDLLLQQLKLTKQLT